MPLSYLPALLSAWLVEVVSPRDARSAPRLLGLLLGALFARGRRTVTSWFRAAGITDQFRPAYHALWAAGRRAESVAACLLTRVVAPLLRRAAGDRWLFALDDTPTPRFGPRVQGAGGHHNPTPGPAGERFVYGHVWVTLAWVARHPFWGSLARPLRALLYGRAKDVPALAKDYPWTFRTKLELAVELVGWLRVWLGRTTAALWLVADGAFAKKAFLQPLRRWGWVVVSRLRQDADLRALPPARRRPGQRGPMPTYGKHKIDLAKRAGQRRGWRQVRCARYGREVVKRVKTFRATWRPAGGAIRVVLVSEPAGGLAFLCADVAASAEAILEAMADRGAIEQAFKDLKEVWGAGQQQVRNVYASLGAYAVNLCWYSVAEAWAWERDEDDLVDRGRCPWDAAYRRPAHADKRKALQREVLGREIQAARERGPDSEEFEHLVRRLVDLAA
jgi:hypothetical protein